MNTSVIFHPDSFFVLAVVFFLEKVVTLQPVSKQLFAMMKQQYAAVVLFALIIDHQIAGKR